MGVPVEGEHGPWTLSVSSLVGLRVLEWRIVTVL